MHGTFGDIASGSISILGQRIAESEGVLANLRDPDFGLIGLNFLQGISQSRIMEREASADQICNNVFIPFVWDEGFVNEIAYKSHMFTREEFVVSRIHENLHGKAWACIPVLHASIFNRNSPVILSPRDWVTLFEMTEADVAAKTAWLCALAAADNPAFYDATKFSPVSVADYMGAYRGDTAEAVAQCAQNAMGKNWGHDNRDGQPFSFGGFYHWLALRDYENMLNFYERNGISPTVVRMDAWHRDALGASFGPNPFLNGRYQAVPLKYLEEQRIGELNARLGITNEGALPYLDTALEWFGHTPDSLLAHSKKPQQPIAQFSEHGRPALYVA